MLLRRGVLGAGRGFEGCGAAAAQHPRPFRAMLCQPSCSPSKSGASIFDTLSYLGGTKAALVRKARSAF